MENPQPTEKITFTEEEQNEMNVIQQRTQEVIYELGEIEMLKIQLNKRQKELANKIEDINKKEDELMGRLQEKYKTSTE